MLVDIWNYSSANSVAAMLQHLLYLNSIIFTLQKRKHSTPEVGTVSLSKRGCITTREKKSKLGTPKEERAVLSHSPQSDQKQKATIKTRQTRRAIEGTIVCSPDINLGQSVCAMQRPPYYEH
jgi:hypothetical protein